MIMRKVVLAAAVLCFAATGAFAQILKPVTWQFGAKKISKDEAVVFIKATMDEGWHIYSQHVGDGGPIKTSFTFGPSVAYTLIGKPDDTQPTTTSEKVLSRDVDNLTKEVVFQNRTT